jgi:hypothetical protein
MEPNPIRYVARLIEKGFSSSKNPKRLLSGHIFATLGDFQAETRLDECWSQLMEYLKVKFY